MLKKLQISDDLFWGYSMIINIDDYTSFDELIYLIKSNLIITLKNLNLMILAERAEQLVLHNHMYNKYDDLYDLSNDDNIIYLCGHCCI